MNILTMIKANIGKLGGRGIKIDRTTAYADKLVTLFGNNIVSYLPLWESTGVFADDYSPNNIDGRYSASNITLGDTGIGDGKTSVKFTAAPAYINWYSPELSATFDGSKGTVEGWFKLPESNWTNGLIQDIVILKVNASNYIRIFKSSAAGRIEFLYVSGVRAVRG